MGKKRTKKVAEKKLIGLSHEALTTLNSMIEVSGKNQTEIINDLLTGKERFLPVVEEMVADHAKKHNLDRRDAIQSLLLEAIAVRHGRPLK